MDTGARDEKAYELHEGDYNRGLGHVMALALNERFGLDIGVILNPNAPDLPEGDFGVVQCFVWVDDTRVLDIEGVRTIEEMTTSWGLSADDDGWTVKPYEPHKLHELCPCTDEELRDADRAFREVYPDCTPGQSPRP